MDPDEADWYAAGAGDSSPLLEEVAPLPPHAGPDEAGPDTHACGDPVNTHTTRNRGAIHDRKHTHGAIFDRNTQTHT